MKIKIASSLAVILFLMIKLSTAQIVPYVVPGATNTYITCVNDSNVVAGYYEDASGIHGFYYTGSALTTFDYPDALQTYVYGINNANTVVGAYNLTGNTTNNEGFKRSSSGTFTDLTSSWLASQTVTIARDINDFDCIIGDYKQNTTHVCFSMCNGVNSTFHYNYKPTYVNTLNNTGKRTGFWIDGSARHGLIYNNGSWTQVDYPGTTRTMITGINDSNMAVGVYNLNRSFIYRNGVFKTIHKTNALDFQARDVNNKGLIVGYYKDSSNTYHGFWMKVWDINFRPNPDGWQFENSDANIWPPEWYSQFNYTHDPYLGGDAPFPLLKYTWGSDTVARMFFPDWPLFVEVLGEDQCYQTGGGYKVIRSKAVRKYFSKIGEWGGSCFGFVQSSFMAWDSIQRFKAAFPKVGPWTSSNKLYALPINDDNRKCINHLMIKQYQKPFFRYINAKYNMTPVETLEEVKKMILDPSKNESGLCLFNQNGSGGHIVNPYKVEVDTVNPAWEYIYVYDNNWPNDTTRKIRIFKFLDSWFYNLAVNSTVAGSEWGGVWKNKGVMLGWPVREFYNQILLDSVAKYAFPSPLTTADDLEIYNPASCDIRILNNVGKMTGYQADKTINDIPESVPMIRANSKQEPPYGYYLPVDEYNIFLGSFKSPMVYLNVFDNSNTYMYSRLGAELNQQDHLIYQANGLEVLNNSGPDKSISLSSIYEDSGNEMSVDISDMMQLTNSTIQIQNLADNKVKLFNSGPASAYNLKIRLVNPDGEINFSHDFINIEANTSHIISPVIDSLQNGPLIIFVDNNNNGSYEDTIYFTNQTPPKILCNPLIINIDSPAYTDTINITNTGGGNLNWGLSNDSPDWIDISGNSSGTNAGFSIITVMANTGPSRKGTLSFTAPGASNNPFKITVNQKGLLSQPGGMTASDGTYNDGVHLSWGSVSGATHYKVFRSISAGEPGNALTNWAVGTSYNDTSALKGQFYYYRVKAAQDTAGLNETDYSPKDGGWRNGFTLNFMMRGNCTGQAVLFKDNSTIHKKVSYSWDIDNDGLIDYYGREVSHVYSQAGNYSVKLFVTDGGQFTDSLTKQLTIQDFPALNLVSDTILCLDQSITLDAGSGFSSYLWSTGATSQFITLDSAGYGEGLHGFYVSVTNDNGCSAIAASRITWENCIPQGNYTVDGTLVYDNSVSSPLGNSIMMLIHENDTVYQTITDITGHFALNNVAGDEYILTATCNKPWGGVNAVDALKVIRHFVGLTNLEGLKLNAADVNGNQVINSIDALLIAKRFVGIDTSFATGDWLFDKDTLSPAVDNTQNINIKALVYGDVDGSYLPAAKYGSFMKMEEKGYIHTEVFGETDIPIHMETPGTYGALSFILNIPPTVIEVLNVSSPYEGNLLYHYENSQLRIAWYSLSPMQLNAGDICLILKCKILTGNIPADCWNLERSSQSSDAEGKVLSDVRISIPAIMIDNNRAILSQNVPNPFVDQCEIGFYLPTSGDVSITIADIYGNIVRELVHASFNQGNYSVTFHAMDLPAGIYSCSMKMICPDNLFTETIKMALIR